MGKSLNIQTKGPGEEIQTGRTAQAGKKLLSSGRTPHVLPLLVLMMDNYPDFLGGGSDPWHPQTIREQLLEDFRVEIPDAVIHRIMCGVELLTSNEFWIRPGVFIRLCNVMGDDAYFNPEVFDPADVEECAWGITQASFIYPPQAEENGGSLVGPDVLGYLDQILREEGYSQAPSPLSSLVESPGMSLSEGEFGDPLLFKATYDGQKEKADIVAARVKELLNEAMSQVALLRPDDDPEDLWKSLRSK